MGKKEYIKGISIINPDEVEKDYLIYCVDYAIKNGYNHIQITGPIHDNVKGNVDGMVFNRKYSEFNGEKDADYIRLCLDAVNAGLKKAKEHGIKTFMWHHELVLPDGLSKAYPEILNENGDIEVTHPVIKDYLENKIADFYDAYPDMDGIVLTLHETKIPLLKLKNQKLDTVGRVKYITEILYNSCKKYGKELIVRPFASLEKDQDMMLKAYSEISKELIVMDKWTKFDWSLSLPDNDFFAKIKDNPFIVEGDVFGEYFGKGRLPIMFSDHIIRKFGYCNGYNNSGFVLRIDRNKQNPFGSVNEVNLVTASALLNGRDVEKAVDAFFTDNYGKSGSKVRSIMEKTEQNQKKIFYLGGYYFTQGSYFPEVNHCKNHFFFEIFRENCKIVSDEWFIPVGWERKSIENILNEKEEAEKEAAALYKEAESLKGEIPEDKYRNLWIKFKNLYYVAKLWRLLALSIYNYTRYFETFDESYERELYKLTERIDEIHADGRKTLGEDFYNYLGARGYTNRVPEFGGDFVACLKANFVAEKRAYLQLRQENLTDFVVCGGCTESHGLKKEVNFSDTLLIDGKQCRIPGNKAGAEWSAINAHGWFSYELNVKKNAENAIIFDFGSLTDTLAVKITAGDKTYELNEEIIDGKTFEIRDYFNSDTIRIRIDRINGNTPCLYTIKVKEKK